MQASWHPECFRCQLCAKELADSGFIRNNNRALCHGCNANIKASEIGKYSCQKCHGIIDGAPLRFRGEVYHGYHFNCTSCGVELDSTAREIKSRTGFAANDMNELYCLKCHDRMGVRELIIMISKQVITIKLCHRFQFAVLVVVQLKNVL